jgi:hypothetical protein
MIAGVITTPNRQKYLNELIKLIAPKVDKFVIFNDLHRQGHTWNYKRCVREATAMAKTDEPVLIMTDDVITVPDWRDRWEELHYKVPNDIYTFFTRKPHMVKYADAGYAKGCFPRGFYDQAVMYINQSNLIDKIEKWLPERGHLYMDSKRASHFDVVIQEYLIDTNQEWVVTVPTLFDHIGAESTLGHDIGGSIAYIGAR